MSPAPTRIAAAPVAVVLGAVMLAACSTSTLRVTPPEPSPNEVELCRELHADLPATVLEEDAREIAPESDLTAAWGDIVLRCGVDRPAALEPLSDVFTVQGVDWFAQQLTKGTRFTTVGRQAYVEIDVSEKYEPEADALVELADTVNRHIPVA